MFDVDGSQVAQLNDTDLRTLIARLCEADLRQAGLPASAVTAGGHQNAPDGGLDVRVDLPPSTSISGFIPRPETGFQVKTSDMPRAEIFAEILPNGQIRPVLQELALASGAYIIVSAQSSTADSALTRRRQAMRDAVTSVQNAAGLTLDFYDRNRIASWVRTHPGLVVWLRERIGQRIRGWRPYGDWAHTQQAADAKYLFDDNTRLRDGRSPREDPLPIVVGMQRIRDLLVRRRCAVRLVGLSGTGKTRLVQALFDERVGSQPLDPAGVIYTDLADPPDPSPRDLIRHLVQNRDRAVVVVDNCPPDTHNALTTICTEPESAVSLITVEYDVGDDDPESTEVFRLEPASVDVIAQLLECRAPQVSQVSRRRIAEFSGGNARIALALAHTVRRGESLASLTDRALFERLFHQRQPQDANLLLAAEVCSLVYSFNGEALEGDAAELPLLAELAGLTVDQVYRAVGELRSRDLVQRRSQWRAVLPPPLANWLAARALERIAPERIVAAILQRGSARLQRSFSRRLGYLHDHETASRIVTAWLAAGGLLGEITRLDPLGISMFENVAPVAPDAVLATFERAASSNGGTFFDMSSSGRGTWIDLLRLLAYDPALFPRAALLLARFIMSEPPDNRDTSASSAFAGLFQLCLSGTHAPIDQRLQVIQTLMESDDPASQSCGLDALSTLLEAWHFSAFHSLDFGARPRDYGWHPASDADVVHWYCAALDYARRLALSSGSVRNRVRAILATQFRGLWTRAGITGELDAAAREIAAGGFWSEGWVAVRTTIRFDAETMPSACAERLRALEERLRPDGLLQTARAYLFSSARNTLDIVDGESTDTKDWAAAYQRVDEATERLGREIAMDSAVLGEILPDLVRGDFSRGWQFGRGLAAGTESLSDLWRRLVAALAATPERDRNIMLLQGFLQAAAARDATLTGGLLDAAVIDPILGRCFPLLQASVHIDARGAERLETALQLGLAPSVTYRSISPGRSIPLSTLRRLILHIAEIPNGFESAIHNLGMRLDSPQESPASVDVELVQCGRELVRRCPFGRPGQMCDFYLGRIVDACFLGDDAAEDATVVCRQLRAAYASYRAHAMDYTHLLASLFRAQPIIALNEFLGNDHDDTRRSLMRTLDRRGCPVEIVPEHTLIAWTQVEPAVRFPRLASALTPFTKVEGATTLTWTPLAQHILSLAPDRVAVLTEFSNQFRPDSWSGSLADILETRRTLPQAFLTDSDPMVVAWARSQDAELVRLIQHERALERQVDTSFE